MEGNKRQQHLMEYQDKIAQFLKKETSLLAECDAAEETACGGLLKKVRIINY